MSPIPSFEELIETDIPEPTPEFLRLRWNVKPTTLADAVHVLADATDAESAQTPFADAKGTLHEISAKPICDPPVSSISIIVDALSSANDDDEKEEEEEDEGPSLEIKAASDKEFVTIGDYVAAAHPWLLELRKEYITRRGGDLPDDVDLWVNPTSLDCVLLTDSAAGKEGVDMVWKVVADYAQNLLDDSFPETTE